MTLHRLRHLIKLLRKEVCADALAIFLGQQGNNPGGSS